ncbi:MAG: 4Fe-4S dicluster domain-containing protein [Desulfobacterales bacterium]|nr:4Fe-4S dicluster domain-containing protein [Desulfobacterales bacterium]
MEWTEEAQAAIKKIPFFVRKRVRKRVEKEATVDGKNAITIDEVRLTQQRFLSKMSKDVKGFQVDTCFGNAGCPHRACSADGLMKKVEKVLEASGLLEHIKKNVKDGIKYHHEFRVTFADCPNGCSQPQIKDIGIIGASVPNFTIEECTLCEACVEACKEGALVMKPGEDKPVFDKVECLYCGNCMKVCPTGTIAETSKGFRVMVGGKLGRHPRLARELPGLFSEEKVLDIVKYCIDFYKRNSSGGKRFAEIFSESDFENLKEKFCADQ